jgi:hypothetical protein
LSPQAFAQSATTTQQLQTLQQQIEAQQQQINQQQQALEMLKAQAATTQVQADKAAAAAAMAKTQAAQAQPANAPAGMTSHGIFYKSSNVSLTMGGFIEAAGIERNHDEVADVGSSFKLGYANGIPLADSANYDNSEFRGTARQSRLSLLAQGGEDMQNYAAYFEFDFLGVGTTSNSAESNSYVPRIRHIYATYDDAADGWHVLGGQTWSLLTLDRVGITPRSEVTPIGIEAQYVTGFTWDRAPQIRVVKDFDKKVWVGFSAETPQASIYNNSGYEGGGGTAVAGVSTGATGGSLLNGSTGTYSLDEVPDLVAKVAFDPGWGHYEVYGVGRWFHDHASAAATSPGSHDTFGGGAGAAAILPVVAKKLDFQLSFLDGSGIGRYGSAQFNDAAVNANNDELTPIPELMALAGLVGHPTTNIDLYSYGGIEQVQKTAVVGTTSGYGNANYSNANCSAALTTTLCTANMKSEWQGTVGGWWKFYQGNSGMMEVGASEAYVHVDTFGGVGGAPHANENIIMTSFRYYPF